MRLHLLGLSLLLTACGVPLVWGNGAWLELVLRLIMDERAGNVRWEDPKKVQLSTLEAIGSLDFGY